MWLERKPWQQRASLSLHFRWTGPSAASAVPRTWWNGVATLRSWTVLQKARRTFWKCEESLEQGSKDHFQTFSLKRSFPNWDFPRILRRIWWLVISFKLQKSSVFLVVCARPGTPCRSCPLVVLGGFEGHGRKGMEGNGREWKRGRIGRFWWNCFCPKFLFGGSNFCPKETVHPCVHESGLQRGAATLAAALLHRFLTCSAWRLCRATAELFGGSLVWELWELFKKETYEI